MAADINAVYENLADSVCTVDFKINLAIKARDYSFVNASASVIGFLRALTVKPLTYLPAHD